MHLSSYYSVNIESTIVWLLLYTRWALLLPSLPSKQKQNKTTQKRTESTGTDYPVKRGTETGVCQERAPHLDAKAPADPSPNDTKQQRLLPPVLVCRL